MTAERTVLITGAGGGLGTAVATAFTEAGWRVVAPVVRPVDDPLQGVEYVTADLAEHDDVARAMRVAASRADAPLRGVVNLVGGYAGDQPVASTPLADFEAQFTLNLRPTYLVCQAALPSLAGGGAIVCVSSRAALHPFAGAAGYVASKAAVLAFARVVAREGEATGVRCNVVLPSQIATPAMLASTPEDRRDALVPPAEIAAVIRFLCGPESAPTNGAAIPVYGSAA